MLSLTRFEILRRARLISTWLYVALFFGLGFLLIGGAGGGLGGVHVDLGTGSKTPVDSPFSLTFLFPLAGHFGVMITASVAGRAICDDVEGGVVPILYTTPISERRFLAGRFLGALAMMMLYLPAIAVGARAALLLPGMDPTRIVHAGIGAYVAPYVTMLLPNLFFTSAIFFSIAVFSRRMLPVLVSGVVMLLGYLLATAIAGDVENRTLAALLDPFGIQALNALTLYWTLAERASRVPMATGLLLANRAIWVSVGAIALAAAARRFSFSQGADVAPAASPAAAPEAARASLLLGHHPLRFDASASRALFFASARREIAEIVKSPSFLVLVIAAALVVTVQASQVDQVYGVPTFPVTYEVLEVVGGGFATFIVLFLAVYAGEVVHRERDARVAGLLDVTPAPRWVITFGKLAALLVLVLVLEAGVLVAGPLTQLAHGFTRIEPGLYLRQLYLVQLPTFAALAVLAVFVHVIVDNKSAGHLVVALVFLGSLLILPKLGIEHHLALYATAPPYKYSDMNGYGHFALPLFWFRTYWCSVAATLMLVAHVAWVEGIERSPRLRLRMALTRLTTPVKVGMAVALALAAVCAGVIVDATTIKNRFTSTKAGELQQADFERKYRHFLDEPAPRVERSHVDIDMFPAERRADVRVKLGLVNRSDKPIDKVLLTWEPEDKVTAIAFGRGDKVLERDDVTGLAVVGITPLAPGASMDLAYTLAYARPGFVNGRGDGRVVGNGSFLESNSLVHVGYDAGRELSDEETRKREKLPPRPRAKDLDDPRARATNYVSSSGDWIELSSVVSTSKDQLPIGPGRLVRSWTEGDRAFAEFKATPRVIDLYAFLSARYAAKRDTWSGADGRQAKVDIEVDYHPDHTWNVDDMIGAVKSALAYTTTNFGPYQHEAVRIVEFPRYENFAQSLPGMIPYSESIGFIAHISGEDAIDLPLYVTAHEVSHQWWGHQVIGADAQGATVLTETLAQYTALMVMRQKVGARSMRRFLRYELDRYLRGRGVEKEKELPLLRVENQPYIHYAKGSLVMYRLQELLSEKVVDDVLAGFVKDWKFKGPPYPTSRDLYERFKAAAPPEQREAVADLFERITLFEARAEKATAHEATPGEYDVTVSWVVRKLYADENGAETEAKLDDDIDFGALDDKGNALAITRKRVTTGSGETTFRVKGKPAKAGIDPLNVLVDRTPEDNAISVDTK